MLLSNVRTLIVLLGVYIILFFFGVELRQYGRSSVWKSNSFSYQDMCVCVCWMSQWKFLRNSVFVCISFTAYSLLNSNWLLSLCCYELGNLTHTSDTFSVCIAVICISFVYFFEFVFACAVISLFISPNITLWINMFIRFHWKSNR